MSNPKNVPPVPIQPKPASGKGSAGASSQMAPVRKQRAGPLVFVNSSDLNTEGEKKGNRKMVKKWAMLNRVGISQTAPEIFPAEEKSFVLTIHVEFKASTTLNTARQKPVLVLGSQSR